MRVETTTRMGRPSGDLVVRYPDGSVCMCFRFKAGMPVGSVKAFTTRPEPALAWVGWFRNGVLSGPSKVYTNGKVVSACSFWLGVAHGPAMRETMDGNVSTCHFAVGKLRGVQRDRAANGSVVHRCKWLDDYKVDQELWWDNENKPVARHWYYQPVAVDADEIKKTWLGSHYFWRDLAGSVVSFVTSVCKNRRK